MEFLLEVPYQQWPIIKNKLKKLWPLNLAGYYALYNNIEYPSIREAFQFKVYAPLGDMENGFVAISNKGESLEFVLFSITEDTQALEQALVKTKLIDWTKLICIDLVSSLTIKAIENVIPQINPTFCKIGKVKTYVLDKSSKEFESLGCPPDTYLAVLNQDDIRRVDDTWSYKHEGSYFYFSTLAAAGLAHGLYSASTAELLAWVFLNEYRFICHLYCEENHRRNGYAESLLKYVVNDELARGNDVYTYVENDNEKSSRLFDKLGFVNVDDGAYVYIQQ